MFRKVHIYTEILALAIGCRTQSGINTCSACLVNVTHAGATAYNHSASSTYPQEPGLQ